MIAPDPQLLDSLRAAADATGLFAGSELLSDRLRLKAKDAAAEAHYEVELGGDDLIVRLLTADRWLSESIESQLVEHGDSLEELLEDELVEIGHEPARDGAIPKVKHFRDTARNYTFECPIPIGPGGPFESARRFLLGWEACFRGLGDMSGGEE
jgi:hypothetical protein